MRFSLSLMEEGTYMISEAGVARLDPSGMRRGAHAIFTSVQISLSLTVVMKRPGAVHS
jgi:hypothetical protein